MRHFYEATGPARRALGHLKRGEIEPPPSAIRVRKEGPRFPGDPGGIAARRTALFSDPNQGKGPPYFLRHFHEADGPALRAMGCLKKGGIAPPASAIRARKEGPVNWSGQARDLRRPPHRKTTLFSDPNRGDGPPISCALSTKQMARRRNA